MSARILLLMLHVVYGEAAEVFLVTPTSLNVTGGTVAEFTCTSRVALSLVWTVNGSELDEPIIQDQGIIPNPFFPEAGVTGNRLTIPTMRATSNTIVVCGALVRNGSTITLEESSALLMLQGPPGRVSRLIGESVSGTLHLSWTPPPTIDLTDIDPDLHYNVSIIKTVFSNGTVKNITAISCVECPLLTPKYTFHGPAGCLSIEYKLSVFAFNTAGSGKISSHSYTGDIPQPMNLTGFVPSNETIKARFMMSETKLRFTILIPTLPVTVCNFTLVDSTNSDNMYVGYPLYKGGIDVILTSSEQFPFHQNYTFNVSACNFNGCRPYQGSIVLNTHNLQAALVDDCSSPGAINVTGIFAKNSTAMGYFVIVSSSDNNKPEQFVAVVGPTHDVLGLTDRISNLSKGVCLIALYDIEGDGLPNTAVSIHSSVEISDGSSTGQLDFMQDTTKLKCEALVTINGSTCISCSGQADTYVVIIYRPQSSAELIRYSTSVSQSRCFDNNIVLQHYLVVFAINAGTINGYPTFVQPPTEMPVVAVTESSYVGIIIGLLLAAFLLFILSVGLVMLVYVLRRWKFVKAVELSSYHNSTMDHRHDSQPCENTYSTGLSATNIGLNVGSEVDEDQDQTQDLQRREDWISHPTSASDEAMTTEDSTAHNVNSDPTYMNTAIAIDGEQAGAAVSDEEESKYAALQLTNPSSEKPFLPRETVVQYSEVQQCSEEGQNASGCLTGERRHKHVALDDLRNEQRNHMEDGCIIADPSVSFRGYAGHEEADPVVIDDTGADDRDGKGLDMLAAALCMLLLLMIQ